MSSDSPQARCAHLCDTRLPAVIYASSLVVCAGALPSGWYPHSFHRPVTRTGRHEAVELCQIATSCGDENTRLSAINSSKFPTRSCEKNLTSRVRNVSHRIVYSKPVSFRTSDLRDVLS